MADELPPSKFGRGYTYGGPPQGPGNSGPAGPPPAGRTGPAGPPPVPPPNWVPPQQNWPAGEPVPRPYPPQRRQREGKPWLWIGTAIVAVVALAGGAVAFVALRGDPSDSGSTSAAPAAPVMGTVPTVLILDASGSMATDDAPGPRLDAAKRAAQGLVDALPDEATIGLTTYGTGTGSTEGERAAGCQDVTTPIRLGPLVRDDMAARIAGLTPSGYTPISLALQRGAYQLPADDSALAIVLVSDGEDTCETPPCDTATQLKQSHPGLTISTVGFKVDGPAADQLRCIADVTGGIFIEAANAEQLASRLLATQNIDQANRSLSSRGIGDVELGKSVNDIRAEHADFPKVSATGTVTVVWRDCDFTFVDGTLDSIAPHDGGRTIDGIASGSSVSEATEFYGEPAGKEIDGGSGTLTYIADEDAGTAYKMTVEDYAESGGSASGTITSVILCRCAPDASPGLPSGVGDDTILSMTFPVGTCGDGVTSGWNQTAPITVVNGEGEARTPSGEFGGASITDARLVGWLDADDDGTEDALVSFTCFGSTIDMCCAGRTGMMTFARVFDFSTPSAPDPIGGTIEPGESPIRGETYGAARGIDDIRIDGSAVITDETLVYPESSGAIEHDPYATIEVTHRFVDGRWDSTERVR